MIKNNRNNEQIYGRNDMIMLDQNNKIYGSLGIADKYVMKTEEGTRLLLSNPKVGKFGDVLTEFNIYGRSEQKQYKGINLFPPNIKIGEYVEVSIPKGSLVFWVTDGTPSKGGNFRFFNEDKTEDMWFGVDAGTTSNVLSLTIDAKYVQNLIEDFDLSKICLGVGSEPIYEPYTGGQPSPSPDYPQEIKSVGDSGNIEVNVRGKNLWDNFKKLSLGNVEQKNGTYIATADNMKVDITVNSVGARPLLLKANNAYTFSLKTTVSISSPKFVCLRYTNGEINNVIFINKNFVNFVPKRDVEKVGFILYESVAGDKVYDVQLEIGSEATPYEPYQEEQTVALPYTLNAIPVSSGGNYTDQSGQQYIADYVDLKRGKYHKRVGEVDLGSLTYVNNGTSFGDGSIQWKSKEKISKKEGSYACMCPVFVERRASGMIVPITNGICDLRDDCSISLGYIGVTNAEDFAQAMQGIMLYYELVEPIERDLTPEEIETYKNLVTYAGTTIVENNYNTWMKATYKSTESV